MTSFREAFTRSATPSEKREATLNAPVPASKGTEPDTKRSIPRPPKPRK